MLRTADGQHRTQVRSFSPRELTCLGACDARRRQPPLIRSTRPAQQSGVRRHTGGTRPADRCAAPWARPSRTLLVVNEELVQVREGPHPSNPEKTRREDQIGSVRRAMRSPCSLRVLPCACGESFEGTRSDSWASDEIAFSQHKVSSKIVRSPTLKECGNERSELGKDITQRTPLLRIERGFRRRRTIPRPARWDDRQERVACSRLAERTSARSRSAPQQRRPEYGCLPIRGRGALARTGPPWSDR